MLTDVSRSTVIQMILLALVLAALVGLIAYRYGRRSMEQQRPKPASSRTPSMFGREYSANDVERGLMRVMHGVVIIANAQGEVFFATQLATRLGLVDGDRLHAAQIVAMLAETVQDGRLRDREVRVTPDSMNAQSGDESSSGRGLRAGDRSPKATRYLQVRVGRIADGLYAIVVEDVSERKHFEQMRRDFVTNVSHELKTPAGAISLLAETLTDAADDPKAVRYFSGRISKESARLTELVMRLIDLQKAQNDVMSLDAKHFPVLDVVREAVQENQVQSETKQISMQISFQGRRIGTADPAGGVGRDVMVFTDRDALKTAVKNLVENAIRYSPPHTTVGMGVSTESGKVLIRVVDQGIGIPADSLDRIFERFYRVDPARSRSTGGTGLGLSIARHCVQECGGTLTVWSRQGEGSTFTIELSLATGRGHPQEGKHV